MTPASTALDQARLDSLSASGLLDPARVVDFEKLTALAARTLRVPVCLVSLVDDKRQVFAGACGLPAPYDSIRETPLSHSFCQHAVALRRPLVIPDSREDPLVSTNGAVEDLGVIAYLGFPIISPDHHFYGAFCAIDGVPREWTNEELDIMREFTALVAEKIELNAALQRQKNATDVLIHDLRSPLAGIKMAADLISERAGELPLPLRGMAGALKDCSEKAVQLVESLASRDRRTSQYCKDLGTILESKAEQLRLSAAGKDIAILFQGTDETLPLDVADWVIEQIAENLLTNAVKFTPVGGSVRISVRRSAGSGIFEIADDGPGFQAEDYSQLFRRYVKLSARPTAEEPSTGLGLSIVRGLIEQEGGSITLTSQPGESAVFQVTLPLAEGVY